MSMSLSGPLSGATRLPLAASKLSASHAPSTPPAFRLPPITRPALPAPSMPSAYATATNLAGTRPASARTLAVPDFLSRHLAVNRANPLGDLRPARQEPVINLPMFGRLNLETLFRDVGRGNEATPLAQHQRESPRPAEPLGSPAYTQQGFNIGVRDVGFGSAKVAATVPVGPGHIVLEQGVGLNGLGPTQGALFFGGPAWNASLGLGSAGFTANGAIEFLPKHQISFSFGSEEGTVGYQARF